MARIWWARPVLLVGVMALAVALGGPAYAKGGGAKVIKIKGSEYTFLGVPKTVTSGKHTLEFTNVGGEHHVMTLVKLNSGVTLDAFLAAPEAQRETLGDEIGAVHIE